jgi:hypothetical protein
LGIHRIPYGRDGLIGRPGPPVLLNHGLTSSSAQWAFGPPEKSLAYILADAGMRVRRERPVIDKPHVDCHRQCPPTGLSSTTSIGLSSTHLGGGLAWPLGRNSLHRA